MQYGFVIDHHQCIGCHACTVACKSENDVPVGDFRTWVKYTDIGTFPAVKRHFAVLRCNQCSNAPCERICPVKAIEKRSDGIVDLDKDACIGCKSCMQACPYDAIYLNEDTGGAEKCHFCAHRIEQGMEPACAVVCPTRAIIPGDFHDPQSEVAQIVAKRGTQVRRGEQRTLPNVHYLGMDDVSLKPGAAREQSSYIWSERRIEAPDYGQDIATVPEAVTVLDVNHKLLWGIKVWVYLVTKGVGAGAAIFAPFAVALGLTGFAAGYLPEVLALVFTGITTALLVLDLKRPQHFLRLLTRPNTKSWLVKGGWVLMGFTAVTVATLVARFQGDAATHQTLRWINLVFGVLTAGYTAFLFAQCEGRDLWQNTKMLLPHLIVQAGFLGGLGILAFQDSRDLRLAVIVAGGLHILFALHELKCKHKTDNARQAAKLLTRVPMSKEISFSAYLAGFFASILVVIAVLIVPASILPALFVLAVAGLYFHERAFVQAGQLPPLS